MKFLKSRKKIIYIFLMTLSFFVFASLFSSKKESSIQEQKPLKVYFGPIGKMEDYDPARIELQNHYAIIRALYSSLVDVDTDGQLVAGWASSFRWDGTTAVFTMRDDAKASDGLPITAHDAAFSLKRLLVLASNTHGDLSSILCNDSKLTSINDPCEAIEAKENELRIKLKKKHFFFFNMLASMDYAIVPERAADPKTLRILNYQISSGPYTVTKVEGDRLSLKANKMHWQYKSSIPKNVDLIALKDSKGDWISRPEMVRAFERKEVDILPTYVVADQAGLVDLAEKHSDISLHMTQPICISVLRFSPHSTRLTPELKFKIGAIMRRAFAKRFSENKFNRKPTNEFFAPVGEGGLDTESKKQVQQMFDQYAELESVDSTGLKLVVSKGSSGGIASFVGSSLPGLKIIEGPVGFTFVPIDGEIPDMMIHVTDTSGIEDITLLGYSLASGIFPYSDEENKKWLQNYIGIENKDERLHLLRKLHFDMLTKPTVVPLSSMPYFAVAWQPWKLNFSELFAGSPLWQIQKEN